MRSCHPARQDPFTNLMVRPGPYHDIRHVGSDVIHANAIGDWQEHCTHRIRQLTPKVDHLSSRLDYLLRSLIWCEFAWSVDY